jgi:uncharacterized protein YegJ (DUF2314 family)
MKPIIVALACAFALATPASHAIAEPTIIGIPATDARMEAAKAQGRATYDGFLRRMAAPEKGDQSFMVKFDLIPGPRVEFIWAADLAFDGDMLVGTLTDEPADKRFRNGQRVPIARADVIDWGYFRNGRMEGGFTERVVIDHMPPEQAAQQRKALGW